MKDRVDTLIVVSNDKLLQIVPENTPLTDAFLVADDILRQGVVGISEIIVKPGLVNVDFADVRAIMGNAGTALMGIGQGKGKTRAVDAAVAAISSPLLDFPITKAKGIVFNIVGGSDMTLQEINSAAEVIYANVDSDANIIFGALVDDKVSTGEVSITVLATGFATDYYEASEEENNAKNNRRGSGNVGGSASAGASSDIKTSSAVVTNRNKIPPSPSTALLQAANPTPITTTSKPSSRSAPTYNDDASYNTRVANSRYEGGEDSADYGNSRYAQTPAQRSRPGNRYDSIPSPATQTPRRRQREEVVYDEYEVLTEQDVRRGGSNDDDFDEREFVRGKTVKDVKYRGNGNGAARSQQTAKPKKRGGIFGFFRRLFGGDNNDNNSEDN